MASNKEKVRILDVEKERDYGKKWSTNPAKLLHHPLVKIEDMEEKKIHIEPKIHATPLSKLATWNSWEWGYFTQNFEATREM